MSARVFFSLWKPLCFWLVVLVASILGGVAFELRSEEILAITAVITAIIMAGIINRIFDNIEQARNWRKPVPPDKVLSFSLEKEMREEKNK